MNIEISSTTRDQKTLYISTWQDEQLARCIEVQLSIITSRDTEAEQIHQTITISHKDFVAAAKAIMTL